MNIGACLKAALKEREFTAPIEQALFAMVANRALSPSSKLAIEQWAAEAVFLGGEETPLQVQHFYRAMDFLLEHAEAIQKEVFWSTASVLNLTVDLIFFDTTNIYISTVGKHGDETTLSNYLRKQSNDKTYKPLHQQQLKLWG